MTGARVALLVLLATVVVAGCGGEDPQKQTREQVDKYARAENRVMQRLAPDVERINRAYVAFAEGKLRPAEAADTLARAERGVRAVRLEVTRLDAPQAARELQARLERYMALSVGLAVQARRLAAYEPSARAALKPLAGLNRRLQRRLADADGASGQAGVLRDYTGGLEDVIADLRRIDAPAVQRPAHQDQIRRLDRTRALGVQLREALAEQDAADVARLLERFRDQAAERVPTRRLTRKGLEAHQRLVARLQEAGGAIRTEQRALYERLGADQ